MLLYTCGMDDDSTFIFFLLFFIFLDALFYVYDTRVHFFHQVGKMFILRGHGKALLVVFSFP